MMTSLRKAGYVLLPLAVYELVYAITKYVLKYALVKISLKWTSVYTAISAHDALISGIITAIVMLVGAAVLLYIMKKDDWELSIYDYLNMNSIGFYRADKLHPVWVSYVVLAIQAVAAAIGLNALLYLTGITSSSASYSGTSSSSYSLPIWFGILLYGFISPGVEELLHRLIIFGRLKRCFPYGVSVIVSALFFGLYHQNLVQLIYGSIMGILMCLACEYVHTIVGAFMVHSIANLTVYILSSIGVFARLGTVPVCVVALLIAVATLAFEGFYSIKSAYTVGVPYGVLKVGLFFVDE